MSLPAAARRSERIAGRRKKAELRNISLYDAIELLFVHRHVIPSDALRSLQDIYTCASANRFNGEPYETWWMEPAHFRKHIYGRTHSF
jgi:hypothetical protein